MGMGKVRTSAAAFTAVALTAVGLVAAPAASADQPFTWRDRVLSTDVFGPFQLAVNDDGVYIADGFARTLSLLTRSGTEVLASIDDENSNIAGVDVSADGSSIAWTTTNFAERTSSLTIRTEGKADVVADIYGYEKSVNPDKDVKYGIIDGGNPCAREFFRQDSGSGLPATYRGVIDSHPYAVASYGDDWIVADAAMNALLKVDSAGNVSTLAVLPRLPVTFTAEQAAGLGAPDCIVGVTYAFESVPTDVEVGKDGRLVVTALAGGPETPALGGRSALYWVDPMTGSHERIARGFFGATNVAVGYQGNLYVTELFGGKITKVDANGRKSTFKEIANPLSAEIFGWGMYVGTAAFGGPGTIQRLSLGG